MSCNQGHITHPEHWSGDEGDVVQALQPFALVASIAQAAAALIGENIGVNMDDINLGFIHPAWRR